MAVKNAMSASALTSYQLDAFGRLRTAPPFTLADLINKYGLDAREWDTKLAGGGTVTPDLLNSALLLTVTAANNDQARLRTHTFWRYQAGNGLTSVLTAFGTLQASPSIVMRSSVSGSVVETPFTQAEWNRDKYPALDIRNNNIYEIRNQWLSAGNVLFYINGRLVHEIENPNVRAAAYMRTAQLPLAAEIINDVTQTMRWGTFDDNDGLFWSASGALGARTLHLVCATSKVDGGQHPPEYSFSHTTATSTVGANASKYMLAIRPKTVFGFQTPFNQVVNRGLLVPLRAQLASETNRCRLTVIVNPTITGASWSDHLQGVSFTEHDTSGAVTPGTGEIVAEAFGPSAGGAGGAVADIPLSELFGVAAGHRQLRQHGFVTAPPTLDTIVLIGTNEQAGNTDLNATLNWGEIK